LQQDCSPWRAWSSVISGFFDGGLGNAALTPALSAHQVFLLLVTAVVAALAARRAVEILR
jgi:hypothetical protein